MKFALLKYLRILYINDNLGEIEQEFIDKYARLIGKFKVVDISEALNEYQQDSYNRIIIFINSKDSVRLIKRFKLLKIDANIVGAVDSSSKEFLLDTIKCGVDRFIDVSMDYEKIIRNAIKYIEVDVLKSKLFESYQYYDALMKFFIVSKTDANGIINYVNDKFCDISGYTQEELIGKSHSIVKHPETPNTLFQNLWSTIRKKEAWQGVIKNLKKDGGFYIVDALIVPLLDRHGNIKEFLSIRKDITEKELLKSKIVNETKERELANEREKAKDSFLILFTHELKTPLNAIINFNDYVIGYLKDSNLEKRDKIINLLNLSRDNASYMLSVVINMLDIARLKSKKVRFNYTTFKLNSLIKGIVNNFSSLIDKKDMDIIIYYNTNCIIKSDELRLSQVVSNILSNAIKYGNKTIIIKLNPLKGYNFFISIEDDGAGISDKKRVFEMYEQDNKNILNKDEGTGIGLYMVKLLCEELNIEYQISDSQTLKGTNFTLKSPKKDNE